MNSITLFLFFIPLLGLILLGVNLIFAPHNAYQEKSSTFECGFHSFLGQNRTQFSISFFVFALLFLVFDLELVLALPGLISMSTITVYGISIMIIFFTVLTVGFAFELGKKALNIDSRQYNNILKSHNLILNFGSVLQAIFWHYVAIIVVFINLFNVVSEASIIVRIIYLILISYLYYISYKDHVKACIIYHLLGINIWNSWLSICLFIIVTTFIVPVLAWFMFNYVELASLNRYLDYTLYLYTNCTLHSLIEHLVCMMPGSRNTGGGFDGGGGGPVGGGSGGPGPSNELVAPLHTQNTEQNDPYASIRARYGLSKDVPIASAKEMLDQQMLNARESLVEKLKYQHSVNCASEGNGEQPRPLRAHTFWEREHGADARLSSLQISDLNRIVRGDPRYQSTTLASVPTLTSLHPMFPHRANGEMCAIDVVITVMNHDKNNGTRS